jgi:transcriptional regulator with GAF, ATPase, and Fis domain
LSDDPTKRYERYETRGAVSCATIRFEDATGPHEIALERTSVIGSSEGAHVRISGDPMVSRVHAELELRSDGPWIRDLGSTNGTFVDHLRVQHARLAESSRVVVGNTTLHVTTSTTSRELWPSDHFGQLLGKSPAMRDLFVRVSKVAASDAPVLILGETGTGKEVVARAIHQASPRNRRPFIVVDCGALPANLLESELFGHAKGAFTGAVSTHIGALEAAAEGTVFLDEIGELPLDLQPKLLRALESRTFRRVGETQYRDITARFVAATHRDLASMVNTQEFREDLFFRLNVLPVHVPPLRDRREDVPILVDSFLRARGAEPLDVPLADLMSRPWTGNVRELRNFVERAVALGAKEALSLAGPSAAAKPLERTTTAGFPPIPTDRELRDVRDEWLDHLEKTYLAQMLDLHGGNVTTVAEKAGLARTYVHRLLRKHGLGR